MTWKAGRSSAGQGEWGGRSLKEVVRLGLAVALGPTGRIWGELALSHSNGPKAHSSSTSH